MSRITVIGGTGYAGAAIVAEAAGRGHHVTALSRSKPDATIPNVTYVQGDATDQAVLASAGERLGRYRLGDDVAVQPEDGGAISAADYALGFVDLIEHDNHHQTQVNLAH